MSTEVLAQHNDHSSLLVSWLFSYNLNFLQKFAILPTNYLNIEVDSYVFHLELLNHSEKHCKLLARESSDALFITLTVDNEPGKSLFLLSSRYVVSNSLQCPSTCFKNLKELSYKLKETIFMPYRNMLMHMEGLPYPGISGIPEDILMTLFTYLPSSDIHSIRLTNKYLCEVAQKYLRHLKRSKQLLEGKNHNEKEKEEIKKPKIE